MIVRTHKLWHSGVRGKFQFYKDDKNQWRWRVVAGNGNILATSSEGYNRLGDAKKGALATCGILSTVNWLEREVTHEGV